MSDKLKPCPFCGGMNLYYAEGMFYAVECADCGGKVVGAYRTEEEAVKAWNRRVQPTFTPDELEELRKKFSSVIHDIPVSYYTEVRKPCIDECTELAFTLDEIDVIARYMRQDFEGNGALERAILKKCNRILKGGSVE